MNRLQDKVVIYRSNKVKEVIPTCLRGSAELSDLEKSLLHTATPYFTLIKRLHPNGSSGVCRKNDILSQTPGLESRLGYTLKLCLGHAEATSNSKYSKYIVRVPKVSTLKKSKRQDLHRDGTQLEGNRFPRLHKQSLHRLSVRAWHPEDNIHAMLESKSEASHLCHNPACVNPNHIVVKTKKKRTEVDNPCPVRGSYVLQKRRPRNASSPKKFDSACPFQHGLPNDFSRSSLNPQASKSTKT